MSTAMREYEECCRSNDDADLLEVGVVLTPERRVETWSHNKMVEVEELARSGARARERAYRQRAMVQGNRACHAKALGLEVGSDAERSAWEATVRSRRLAKGYATVPGWTKG